MINQAAATSGGYGFRFDAAGAFNHLFDPVTGQSPKRYLSVTTVMQKLSLAGLKATSTATPTKTQPSVPGRLPMHSMA